MNKINLFSLLFVSLFFMTGLVFANSPADVVAKLDAFDGTITVVRSGAPLQASEVDTGFAFENNDQIKVSPDGSADISVDTKNGIKANLHLKSSTVVLLDLTSFSKKGQTGALDLLSGSVSLKVQKLVGANRLEVHTETANMGVRGTVFMVDTELDGSTLLTTDEGRVELTPDQGAHHFSVPGVAVRGDGDEKTQWAEAKVTDSSAFIEDWHTERLANFESHREAVLGNLADRYQRLSVRFDNAYARLEENKELWSQWSTEERTGNRSASVADTKLRGRIENNLMIIRQIAWSLERVHHRLGRIETRLGSVTFSNLNVKTAFGDWSNFVAGWHAGRQSLETRLAMTHYRVKLFALRHGGQLLRLKKPEVEKKEEVLTKEMPVEKEPAKKR